ncbi:IkappaB kinase complex, IKAP component, partial [Ramicandelaber brevisporus]
MRNFVLLNEDRVSFNQLHKAVGGSCPARPCADLASGTVFYACQSNDAEAEIAIMRVVPADQLAIPLCDSLPAQQGDTVRSMRFLVEHQAVFVATAFGSIFLVHIDAQQSPTGEQIELIGGFDGGIDDAEWSPDDEILTVATGDGKLVLMTNTFDVICELNLNDSSEEQAVVQNVSVGWGRKETQFHGRANKAAAQQPRFEQSTGNVAKDDDLVSRLSWRGDCAFFSLNYVGKTGRVLNIYNRDGVLQSVSESIRCLEWNVAWRPNGSLIASSEQLPGESLIRQIIFYERNGLRHGEFELRSAGAKVVDLHWNSNSTVLAITMDIPNQSGGFDRIVQLWADRNYHWYLVQELSADPNDEIISCSFDNEVPGKLYLGCSNSLIQYDFTFDVIHGSCPAVNNAAVVAVADGNTIKLTPMQQAIVPPPMSFAEVNVSYPVRHIAFSHLNDANNFAVLLSNNSGVLFSNCINQNGKFTRPSQSVPFELPSDYSYRQIVYSSGTSVLALGRSFTTGADHLVQITWPDVSDTTNYQHSEIELTESGLRLVKCPISGVIIIESVSGLISEVQLGSTIGIRPIMTLPEPVSHLSVVPSVGGSNQISVAGQTSSGRLYLNDTLLSNGCTSFFVHPEFLMYTTTAHTMRLLPIKEELFSVKQALGHTVDDDSCRRVERGSHIVVACSVGGNVVLQMPRGNLEAITPRALILESIRHFLDHSEYGNAFVACRKHRVDLNIIIDHNPSKFISEVNMVVDQLRTADSLNLLISNIENKDVTKSMYKEISILPSASASSSSSNNSGDLSRKDDSSVSRRLLQPIITSYIRCSQALNAMKMIQDMIKLGNNEDADSAIKYLMFLINSDEAFKAALQLYDLKLALLVAGHAQMDPREYLSFLSELDSLQPAALQRFRIDDHLQRYNEAALNLLEAGSIHHEKLLNYIKQHGLYEYIIEQTSKNSSDPRRRDFLIIYAEHLFESKLYFESAQLFMMVGEAQRAIESYKLNGNWEHAAALAHGCQYNADQLKELGRACSEVCYNQGKYSDAAEVLIQLANDHERAFDMFVEAKCWMTAINRAHVLGRSDLILTHIQPGVETALEHTQGTLDDFDTQIETQSKRMKELRVILADQYVKRIAAVEDESLDNVDAMSEATSRHSMFTRYTVAGSQASATSSARTVSTSKNRKREERKKAMGKKGTPYEAIYIANSAIKLSTDLTTMVVDIKSLVDVLIYFGKMDSARDLLRDYSKLIQTVEDAMHQMFV